MKLSLPSWMQLHRKVNASDVQRPVETPPQSTGLDSHPALFRGVPMEDINRAQRKWLSSYDPLDTITVDTVRECFQESLRGAYARQQWVWDKMEMYDAMMSTCVGKRETAVAKYSGNVIIKSGLSDRDELIAESQQRTISDLISAIDNMDEAIIALSQASRRHYKFLQPYEDSRGLHLLPIDNWLFCRDGYDGAWRWNPRASMGTTRGEQLPVPVEGLIYRICPRPIMLPAQMLIISRKITLAQWDVFLGRYGTPPLFLIMPPDISEAVRDEYISVATQCVSNAAGALPAGSDIKSAPVPTASVDMFDRRYKIASEEIVMLATGGKLTVMTEAGSGTLAGGAQQDYFDDWGAGEAEEISAVLTQCLVNRVLAQYHPGQRALVEYKLNMVDKSDPAQEIANVSSLRLAGYDLDESDVAQRTGWDVKSGVSSSQLYAIRAAGYSPEQAPMEDMVKMPLKPITTDAGVTTHSSHLYNLYNARRDITTALALHRSSILYPPARDTLARGAAVRLAAIDRAMAQEARAVSQLTPEEVAAVKQLTIHPDQADLVALAEAMTPLITDAVKLPLKRPSTPETTT